MAKQKQIGARARVGPPNEKRRGQKKPSRKAPIPAPGIVADDDDLQAVAEADAPRPATEPPAVPTAGEGDPRDAIAALLGELGIDARDPRARRVMQEVAARLADGVDLLAPDEEPEPLPPRWARTGVPAGVLRGHAERVDAFGLDPTVERRTRMLLELVYRHWFRVQTRGLEHIASEGPVMLVANHSGALPWDALMLKTAIVTEHPQRRELRWLAEDFVFHFPFLGTLLNRIGAVRANPENAERLLRDDRLVAVFPEGVQGMGKLYRERYRLQRFGRGGYVKLALRTGARVVPTAVVGAEETAPLLARVPWLAKSIGLPFLPITPTFPALGPLGLVPLPTRWTITFGPPIDLSDHRPEDAADAIVVQRINDRIRGTVQTMVDDALAERGSVLFG